MTAAAAIGVAAETASAMPAGAAVCTPARPAVEVQGSVASGYERLREAFAAGQANDPGGARLCVYRHGRVVADLWCGYDPVYNRPYTDQSLSVLFSATKGLVSACLHILVDHGLVDIEAPVARYWPEFAANGKDKITVASVLAHTAGLSWFTPDSGIQLMGLTDWQRCTAALAAMKPLWTPGAAYQYHSATPRPSGR